MALTDDQMVAALRETRPYTIVVLMKTEKYGTDEADRIVWEHGRRNFDLRRSGELAVVFQVTDGSAVAGISVFGGDEAATRAIMDADPAVAAGIFRYDLHLSRSFPGDALPG